MCGYFGSRTFYFVGKREMVEGSIKRGSKTDQKIINKQERGKIMRKIKNSLLVLLAMLLVLLAGCKNNEGTGAHDNNEGTGVYESNENTGFDVEADISNKQYITSKEAFVNKMEELLDLSIYSYTEFAEYTKFKQYTYELSPDKRANYDFDYVVKLEDGSTISMPITFGELDKKGWKLVGGTDPDQEIPSNTKATGTIRNASGKELTVLAYNLADETTAYWECTILELSSEQYVLNADEKERNAVDFAVCDNLNNASRLEDIIQELGQPTIIECALHYDDNGNYICSKIDMYFEQKDSEYIGGNSQMVFLLSGDGNYILSFTYRSAAK